MIPGRVEVVVLIKADYLFIFIVLNTQDKTVIINAVTLMGNTWTFPHFHS